VAVAKGEGTVERVRWGILGTGRIAADFATGLQALPDAELAAVGSRSAESAAAFADRFGAARRHPSYAALAEDPEVDIVYVATPHPLHHENARTCLEAGKAVLCEKPFTLNAAEARDLVRLAHERGLFLMEAMWTRFLPAVVEVRRLLAAGAIGEARFLTADFGFRKAFDPRHRLFDPALGGGALLDVGVYLASLSSMVFGPPAETRSLSQLGSTGVDERAALLFGYGGGRFAQLTAAIATGTPQEATVVGDGGWIRLHPLWWKATSFTLAAAGREPETVVAPYEGNGYTHEAAEAMRCLRAGLPESPGMPLAETVEIIETLDRVRAEWGLRYPGE
jgi:predicted dehydrogenase